MQHTLNANGRRTFLLQVFMVIGDQTIERPAIVSEQVGEQVAKAMFWLEFGRWPTIVIHTVPLIDH